MEIYDVVKTIRLEKNVTQQQLADALNIEKSSYSRIETGKQEFRVSQLKIISQVLGVRIIDLFTYPVKYVIPENETRYRKVSLTLDLSEEEFSTILNLVNTK